MPTLGSEVIGGGIIHNNEIWVLFKIVNHLLFVIQCWPRYILVTDSIIENFINHLDTRKYLGEDFQV